LTRQISIVPKGQDTPIVNTVTNTKYPQGKIKIKIKIKIKMKTNDSSQDRNKSRSRYTKKHGNIEGSGSSKKTMTGAEESMGDHVYSCTDVRSGDKYGRTTEALVLHIQKHIDKVGAKVADTIRNMHRLDLKNTEDYDVIVVQVMWTRLFLEAQGYTSETTIYQDNTSAMLMERNGTERSSKQTRHINIRYYYIKDCTDKRLLDIKYCPTDDMLGGFPSKPLQGKKFVTHLKDLLNFEFMTSVVHRSAC
jgi:hypothetical protein